MNIIKWDLKDLVFVEYPITLVLCCLPNIHTSLSNQTIHPIVLGQGSYFNPTMILLEKLLRIYAYSVTSYICDTIDTLNRLDEIIVMGDCMLVLFDAINLYTSINHTIGLSTI